MPRRHRSPIPVTLFLSHDPPTQDETDGISGQALREAINRTLQASGQPGLPHPPRHAAP
jgi:hypothetical protein